MLGYEIPEILLIFGKIASNLLYWHLIREIGFAAGASKIGPLLKRTFRSLVFLSYCVRSALYGRISQKAFMSLNGSDQKLYPMQQ